MSKRTDQVEKIVQQAVATGLAELLESSASATVRGVDVSPDLKHATVWVGVIGRDPEELMAEIQEIRAEVQEKVAGQMTTKFTPKLHFRHDTSGEYAEKINRILKDL